MLLSLENSAHRFCSTEAYVALKPLSNLRENSGILKNKNPGLLILDE